MYTNGDGDGDQNYLLTQVKDSRLGKLTYQYDAIGRLTQSQSLHQTESFAFDPAGNLIDPIATQTSQIKSNLISQYKGKNYKYDAQGNVIETSHAGKTLKLTWDNLNRLVRSDHNGQVTEYGYDVFGRRLFKKNQNAQTLTLFGWDGDLMIWESQQSNKAEENYTKHYIYEPKSFVPLLQTGYTGFIKLLETPDYTQFKHEDYSVYKDPIWKTETRKNKAELERVAFYHCDQVGTPQTLTNELGECVWEIKQDTWGTALAIKASNSLLEQTNIRFQGQYYDDETGLHYNRYRYYEPFSARYISKDPIGLDGGFNNSSYVSDPNQWVDPMGLMADKTLKEKINFQMTGAQEEERMKKQSKYVRATDRALNGMSANITVAAGLGITTSTAYVGNGKVVNSTGRTLGAGLAVSTTRDVFSVGNKPDGRYLELCGGIGASYFGQACAGISWDTMSLYGVVKGGTGAGAGVSITDGWQNTGNMVPETPKYVIRPEDRPIIPTNPINLPF